MEYYVIIDGRKCGPYSHEELRSKFVTPNMPVWHEGLIDWAQASDIPELCDVLQPDPTPLPYNEGGAQGQNTMGNGNEEYVPPMPNDYRTSNIFLIIFGFFLCQFCFIGSVFALISYFKSNDMQMMHALKKYDLMAIKADEVRKFNKLAIRTNIISVILGIILAVICAIILFGSFYYVTSHLYHYQ